MTIAGLLMIPSVFFKNLRIIDKPNPLNNKNEVSGVRKSVVSRDLSLDSIK